MKIEDEILKIQKKLIEIDLRLSHLNDETNLSIEVKPKSSKISEEEFDLNRVSEKAYKRTFWLMVFIVLGASVGNSAARWLLDNPTLELIPKTVFDFIKDVAYIFVIPVSIKIIGDKVPIIVDLIKGLSSVKDTVVKKDDKNLKI